MNLKLEAERLPQLLEVLRSEGYVTIAPTIQDGAIVYEEIDSVGSFPFGWSDEQGPAYYRLNKGKETTYFGFTAAPQSWKRFLYPPRLRLFSASKDGKSVRVSEEPVSDTKYAFIGVRPCELSAISIHDRVLMSGEQKDANYASLRDRVFIVAVNCTRAGENCFCVSMKAGPKADSGFDIGMTEVSGDGVHHFIVETGSSRGEALLKKVKTAPASNEEVARASQLVSEAARQMSKHVDVDRLPEILIDRLDHQEWDKVAARCMTCGNCTMVCPTCFCTAVEDLTDLSGTRAERSRRWDSCFTLDFAKVAGGNFRISPKSRYRQWLTHKFSSWFAQFGTFGCVGCGRCITWCPAGIDITAELQAIRGAEIQQTNGG